MAPVVVDYTRLLAGDVEKWIEDCLRKGRLLDIVGNACFENPDREGCAGTKEIVERADIAVADGGVYKLYECETRVCKALMETTDEIQRIFDGATKEAARIMRSICGREVCKDDEIRKASKLLRNQLRFVLREQLQAKIALLELEDLLKKFNCFA